MKLVVGSRGNYLSTKSIIDGTEGRIGEVYFSVDNARWGSGRSYVHHIDFSQAARQASYARRFGVDMAVAFNTVCFGGQKFTGQFLREFTEYLGSVEKAGIRSIILSDPYLMEIVKDEFPGLSVIVSVFAEVDSEIRLFFYNDLGVDRIIVPHELNRNLRKLERFAKISRCPLEVIVNLGCSHYCARGDSHSIFTGHYCGSIMQSVVGDYYTNYCNHRKLNRPWEILGQDWIRPEDLRRYEDLGITYFKLAGRAASASFAVRAARAYLERSYDGNLMDLISSYFPFTDKMPEDQLPLPPIPNKTLDKYMHRLYNCGHKCSQCGACREIYEEIIKKNSQVSA